MGYCGCRPRATAGKLRERWLEEISDEVSSLLGRQGLPAHVSWKMGNALRVAGFSAYEVQSLLPPVHGALDFYGRQECCAASPASYAAWISWYRCAGWAAQAFAP